MKKVGGKIFENKIPGILTSKKYKLGHWFNKKFEKQIKKKKERKES